MLAAIAPALWLGILTSLSPCPLASNIAAVSFVGRDVRNPRRVLAAGIGYSLGRAATYVLVGAVAVSSVLSIPSVSFFLQERMNQVLGPLLIVIGVVLLGRFGIPLPRWSPSLTVGRRAAAGGALGAAGLGALLALSFCPVSAGLFFGALIPLAANAGSRVVVPAAFGVGTGLPVLIVAGMLALGAQGAERVFHGLTAIEKVARPATGVVFLLAGAYFVARHLLGFTF